MLMATLQLAVSGALVAGGTALMPVADLPVPVASSHGTGCLRHADSGRPRNAAEAALEADRLRPPREPLSRSAKHRRSDGDRRAPAGVIDDQIFGTLAARGIPPAPPASDAAFLRRVSLDLAGRLPTPPEVRSFLASHDPDKRRLAVDRLLASADAVDHWTVWLRDLVGVTEVYNTIAGRNATWEWLHLQVAARRPLDELVADLLTAAGDGRGPGPQEMVIRWLDDPATIQDAYDNVAVGTTQRLLGVRALCISCHHGRGHLERVNTWLAARERQDVWGMAAFWAHTGFEYHEGEAEDEYWFTVFDVPGGHEYEADTEGGDRPPRRGGVVEPAFLLDGRGPLPGEPRREALARLVTQHPQFARNLVNRVWRRLMVVGLVEPYDDWDLDRLDPDRPSELGIQTVYPELLNRLAAQLEANDHDLFWLVREIATSEAYGLAAEHPDWDPQWAPLYARSLPRRLSAEELLDAVVQAGGRPVDHWVAGWQEPVRWARQLPGWWEPNSDAWERDLSEARLANLDWDAWGLLQLFGRGTNDTVARSADGSISQALGLMNSSLVNRRAWADDYAVEPNRIQRLLADGASPAEAVEELYLATLSRLPTAAERAMAVAPLEQDLRSGLEDLMWALLNSQEFRFRP